MSYALGVGKVPQHVQTNWLPGSHRVKRGLLAAFGEDQGDVVVLFLGAEAEDFFDHGG